MPADRSSHRSATDGRAAEATAGNRSSSWWIHVPRSAAARIAALGAGALSSSVPMDEGASGRGGRASGGAGDVAQSGTVATGSSTFDLAPLALGLTADP